MKRHTFNKFVLLCDHGGWREKLAEIASLPGAESLEDAITKRHRLAVAEKNLAEAQLNAGVSDE